MLVESGLLGYLGLDIQAFTWIFSKCIAVRDSWGHRLGMEPWPTHSLVEWTLGAAWIDRLGQYCTGMGPSKYQKMAFHFPSIYWQIIIHSHSFSPLIFPILSSFLSSCPLTFPFPLLLSCFSIPHPPLHPLSSRFSVFPLPPPGDFEILYSGFTSYKQKVVLPHLKKHSSINIPSNPGRGGGRGLFCSSINFRKGLDLQNDCENISVSICHIMISINRVHLPSLTNQYWYIK